MSARSLRVALLGSRGIPARYGGYETLMEELSVRLVERGLAVTVYCRTRNPPWGLGEYRGVRLVRLPTVPTKHLDTPVHTLLSCLDASRRRFDAALVVNSANALFVPLLQLRGLPVALAVDGIESQRAKWGSLGRLVYRVSERLAAAIPHALVTDARVIQAYYQDRYRRASELITYGVEPRPVPAGETLRSLGLTSRGYFLYVSRFEPENNPHRIADAYRRVAGDLPLVMVGGAPYAARFIESFTTGADPRIVFPGTIYGDGYRELLTHALAYVQATEVGGTHPALVEAMGYGNCILANDTPEHREVAGDAAIYFAAREPASIARAFETARSDARLAAELRRRAAARARALYTWDAVADAYAGLLDRLARG